MWFRKGGRKSQLEQTSRRNLFELHAGRQIRQLPSKLLLEEMSPPQKTRPDLLSSRSEDLIAALGPVGLEYKADSRSLRGKLDLSYVGDPALLSLDRSEASKQAWAAKEEIEMMREKKLGQVSLKGILVQYLRHVDPILKYQARSKESKPADKELDDALLELLNKDNTHYLSIGGRDITDLMTWSWILTSETTERAATRLLAVAHQKFTNETGQWSIPAFVYIFLLRRRNPSAEALRSLLIYAWQLMENLEKVRIPSLQLKKFGNEELKSENLKNIRPIKGITERVFMVLIIRLLRSARRVWPAACNSIVALISRYLDGVNFRQGLASQTDLNSEDIARLTYIYNTLLKLVALPASIGPFRSAFHQQQAQFSLLRRMNAFQPPLVVDRKGYRAVVSMQLRHKKTLREREWAQMKARSWPPWKEEKLGIDADITVEHGTSRAMEAIRRSWEAGYAPDDWDAVASILSGWDTDRSPTIQTRAVHQPSHGFRPADEMVWVSRIRATRTLDEAWSCFLSYKDERHTHLGSSYVYHAMFAKILQNAKRLCVDKPYTAPTKYIDEQQPLPGDGVEVLAAPESPREAVYVRIPPPDIGEFIGMMAKDKVKPHGRLLSSMLVIAPTLEIGLEYVEASMIPNAHKRILSNRKRPTNYEDQAALESVPQYLFSSFVRLLTQFPPMMPDTAGPSKDVLLHNGSTPNPVLEKTRVAQPDTPQSTVDPKSFLELASPPGPIARNPLLEAIELVLARKPPYRPVWYHLLRALSKRKVMTHVFSGFVDQNYQDIKTWQMTCRLLNEMFDIGLTLDLEGFHILCTGLEKAIFASEKLSRRSQKPRRNNDASNLTESCADQVLSGGLPLLKQIFKDAVRSKSMQQELPTSLTEETSRISEYVKAQGELESDDIEEDRQDGKASPTAESRGFLPPGCLLPELLEVPHPACLHAFVRVLGLRRDYDGLLDLVEWMSLFADEINAVADESANGNRMMRRCLIAIQVFMERSWIVFEKREAEARGEDPSTVHDERETEAEPAPAGIVKAVKEVVKGNNRWGGWPEPDEVEHYCTNGIFI